MNAAKSSEFKLARVLWLVVPLVVVIAAGALFFGAYDGLNWIKGATRPQIVPARGRVTWNGEPLPSGVIASLPGNDYPGGLAEIKDGEFKLATDINGQWIDGVCVGEHRVTVSRYGPPRPAASPDLLTPPIYRSAETTPLRITVTKNPDQNVFELKLEGETPAPTPPPPPPPSNDGNGQGGGGRDPQAMVDRLFGQYDKDTDGVLNAAEIQAIEGMAASFVPRADQDQDGQVTRQEMEAAAQNFAQGGRGGDGGRGGGRGGDASGGGPAGEPEGDKAKEEGPSSDPSGDSSTPPAGNQRK